MTAILKAYADQLGVWQAAGMAKALGPKPTADQIMTYARLGARHGKQCFAGAMALRELGVTGSEIVIACGAPQLNKMRGFIADALVKRIPLGKRNGNEIYKLVLTPKGEKRIANTLARELAAEAAGQAAAEAVIKKVVRKNKRNPGDAAALLVKAADAGGTVKARVVAGKPAKPTSEPRKPGKTVPAANVMTEASATATVPMGSGLVNEPGQALIDLRAEKQTQVTDQTLLPTNNV